MKWANNWRKNGVKLARRKAIREEACRRMHADRADHNARSVYDWSHGKIRAFYRIAPLDVVWPIFRTPR